MHRSSLTIALGGCLMTLGLAACDGATDNEPAVAVEPGRGTEPDAVARGDSPSMRYSCEGGFQVAILGETARVTTRDGRVIDLSRVPDRSPPLFAGEALEFSVEADGAVLGQDEGGPFPCKEAR